MRKTKAVLVVILAALVGAAAALAGGAMALSFQFAGQAPDTVSVRRGCYPGTLDAVYVSRATNGLGDYAGSQLWVVPGGCTRGPVEGPVTNGSR